MSGNGNDRQLTSVFNHVADIGTWKSRPSFGHDLPLLNGLVSEMTAKTKQVREHVEKLRQHIVDEEHKPEAGISLLELKVHLLMSYLVNLVQVVHLKTEGQLICDTPPIHRLVEIRTVLERIRPLDHKLKYQVDKLIRTATTGMASASDPLRFKPNPSNLVSKLEDSSLIDDDSQAPEAKVYVPPKAVSVPFNDKPQSRLRIKPRAALMEELKEEVLGMPTEVKTSFVAGGSKKQKELAEQKQLEEFEENHMMRMTRKRKSQDTGRSNRQEIDDLADFSEFSFIPRDAGRTSGHSVKTVKQTKKSKKKKGYRKRK